MFSVCGAEAESFLMNYTSDPKHLTLRCLCIIVDLHIKQV